MTKVEQLTRQQLQRQGAQYADNQTLINMFEPQVGQQLVQQQILLQEAHRLGIHATDDDVRNYLQTGPTGQVLYPDGKFIGQDQYAALIADRLNMTVAAFEQGVKDDIIMRRLEGLITAGVTVEPAGSPRASIGRTPSRSSSTTRCSRPTICPRPSIPPTPSSNRSSRRMPRAMPMRFPKTRTISYFAFTPNEIPGGIPQPTQQQIQAYYQQHQSEYQQPEQAKARHILISSRQCRCQDGRGGQGQGRHDCQAA